MAKNTYIRARPVAAGYQSLGPAGTVLSFVLECPETNTSTVYLQGIDGVDVPLGPGAWYQFWSVDLSSIRFKGTPPDQVIIVGQTS